MEERRADLNADAEERAEAPDFDESVPAAELVRGERTRDDFLDAVLGLDSPATAKEVAELAGHGVDAAREYLEWFERMGIVTQVTASPMTYERNQAYLNWRRVQELQREYPSEELLALLQTAVKRTEAFEAEFGVDAPDAVTISDYASTTGQTVEAVWERLTAWRTARRRVELLERALAGGSREFGDRY